MKSTRTISNTSNHTKKESTRKGSLHNSVRKQIPRVEIFLDRHLNRAIQQIRSSGNSKVQTVVNAKVNQNNFLERNKLRSSYEEEETMQQSFKGKNSAMLLINDHIDNNNNNIQSLQGSPGSKINSMSSKHPVHRSVILQTKKNIEIVPNDIVLDYVHQVYEKYGIENPFEGYWDGKVERKQGRENNSDHQAILIKQDQSQQQQRKNNINNKNWHSFSQRKDRPTTIINQQNSTSKYSNHHNYIDQKVSQYPHNDDDSHQIAAIISNYTQTFRTQKKQPKKMSQNQQRILELKNKFREIGDMTGTICQNNNNINNINNNNLPFQSHSQQQSRTPKPPRHHFYNNQPSQLPSRMKQSNGNITYIDNLKNLMQSQATQFDTQSKQHVVFGNGHMNYNNNVGNDNEQQQKVSVRFIDSMGEIVYDESEVKQKHHYYNQSPYHQQSAQTKPKKKLFVKTKIPSTKYNSVQATPMNQTRRKVTFDQHFLISQSKHQQLNMNSNHHNNPSYIYQQSIVNNNMGNLKHISMQQSLMSSFAGSGIYIPQYHRYCLGCEHAILDSNIMFHEQTCDQLKKISNYPLQQLLKLIDRKLMKIKSNLSQSELFNLQMDDINEIKSLGSKVLSNQCSNVNDKNNQINGNNFNKEKQNLTKIDRLLEKKLLRGCEMIKKIQWFSKLKATIEKQLSSHSQGINGNLNTKEQNTISTFTLK